MERRHPGVVLDAPSINAAAAPSLDLASATLEQLASRNMCPSRVNTSISLLFLPLLTFLPDLLSNLNSPTHG
jgi:hypothetical protein